MRDKLERIISSRGQKIGTLERELRSSDHLLFEWINSQWTFGEGTFSEKVHYALHQQSPFCDNGNRKKVVLFKDGFTLCGKQCACAREKKKATMLARHGVEHAHQSSTLRQKAKDSLKEKFGTDQLHLVNAEQKKVTNQERYGADTPLQSAAILAKTRETYFDRTGVEYPFQNKEVQEKVQEHWEGINGTKSFVHSDDWFDDRRRDLLEQKFGPTNASILLDREKFSTELRGKSRIEFAKMIGCSPRLIEKWIVKWNLDEFRDMPSYYEVLIERFLDELGVTFVKNTRKIIAPKELDYYLPDHNLAIEFHGLRWHSENFGKKDKKYHLEKMHACHEKGIRLIQIFQDEWDNSSHIVRDIIKKAIGVTTRVMARKTKVVSLGMKEAMVFLDENHLQGFARGTVNYGLKHGDELVSVMSFAKSGDGAELVRFANKVGMSVVGGAAKLMKHYVSLHSPSAIFSYSDNRYFDGSMYSDLGFTLTKDTGPGYHYLVDGARVHRLNYTKKKLVSLGYDLKSTEWEIMKSLGHDRIWDCGHRRWDWRS